MSLNRIFPIEKWNFITATALKLLTVDDYNRLLINSTCHIYKKGEIIFRENTLPAGVFLMVNGKVKKYKIDYAGKKQTIYVAGKGELVGYHAVLSRDRYSDSAAALEASRIYFIPIEDFMFTIKNCPPFAQQLLGALSHEVMVLANTVLVFAKRNAAERLAIALIVLREKYKDDTVNPNVAMTISRADLADITGIAEENVTRLLKEFKDESLLIREGRKIVVTDIKGLVKRANYR
ncbi:Crp/Fnr family transcriptional regulator [Mucilaginibacter sp. OK283]|jgi:CRP-like cAMP-binding protein|uniref:Crp/Fnr family transcriptional regulator n=1 Tax=Mucilaginibacter sp. OK283 TaxID=1881049 RepID=UPI0008B9AA2A|nr:Crp/Fnr family transcriptional regulator [Mucilaginibacter sp. OK283]SEP35287.1 transcriptional regulator, Crp/Fnr family [Mucilaginibacter sp. OK283]